MDGIFATVGAAVAMFAGTNIDDLIVLTVLFLSARATGLPRPWQTWAGQYLGIATLVAASLLAALGLLIVPDQWAGLLGLVPLILGVRALITAIRSRGATDEMPPVVAKGLLSVAGITIANGADNIAVYTPVFRAIGPASTALTIAVFAVGVAVWCVAGSWLGSHPTVVRLVERYGRWLMPAVFITIGLVIIIESV